MGLKANRPTRSYGWKSFLAPLVCAVACPFLSSLQAAENIIAHRDATGRVVFVNEGEASPAQPAEGGRTVLASATSESSAESESSKGAVPAESFKGRPADVHSIIDEVASRHQVDPELVRAIVRVESNFNPYAVSSRGARGLMQLVPATARRFGVRNAFDPRSNLDGGLRYLKHLLGVFDGDLRLSLAAYNAGEQAVARNRGVPPYRETQNYLRKIAELYPLRSMPGGVPPEPSIVKFVDSDGVVHFSNTDVP
jgi:soluble lytic murein transglycosylase-like protein